LSWIVATIAGYATTAARVRRPTENVVPRERCSFDTRAGAHDKLAR
jgi:hypothetical protein